MWSVLLCFVVNFWFIPATALERTLPEISDSTQQVLQDPSHYTLSTNYEPYEILNGYHSDVTLDNPSENSQVKLHYPTAGPVKKRYKVTVRKKNKKPIAVSETQIPVDVVMPQEPTWGQKFPEQSNGNTDSLKSLLEGYSKDASASGAGVLGNTQTGIKNMKLENNLNNNKNEPLEQKSDVEDELIVIPLTSVQDKEATEDVGIKEPGLQMLQYNDTSVGGAMPTLNEDDNEHEMPTVNQSEKPINIQSEYDPQKVEEESIFPLPLKKFNLIRNKQTELKPLNLYYSRFESSVNGVCNDLSKGDDFWKVVNKYMHLERPENVDLMRRVIRVIKRSRGYKRGLYNDSPLLVLIDETLKYYNSNENKTDQNLQDIDPVSPNILIEKEENTRVPEEGFLEINQQINYQEVKPDQTVDINVDTKEHDLKELPETAHFPQKINTENIQSESIFKDNPEILVQEGSTESTSRARALITEYEIVKPAKKFKQENLEPDQIQTDFNIPPSVDKQPDVDMFPDSIKPFGPKDTDKIDPTSNIKQKVTEDGLAKTDEPETVNYDLIEESGNEIKSMDELNPVQNNYVKPENYTFIDTSITTSTNNYPEYVQPEQTTDRKFNEENFNRHSTEITKDELARTDIKNKEEPKKMDFNRIEVNVNEPESPDKLTMDNTDFAKRFQTLISEILHKSPLNIHNETTKVLLPTDVYKNPENLDYNQFENSIEPVSPDKLTPWNINFPESFDTHVEEYHHKSPSNIRTEITKEEPVLNDVHKESSDFNQHETNLNEPKKTEELTPWDMNFLQRFETFKPEYVQNEISPSTIKTEIIKDSDVHEEPENIFVNKFESNSNELDRPDKLTPWKLNFPQPFETHNIPDYNKKIHSNILAEITKEEESPSDVHKEPESIHFDRFETNLNEPVSSDKLWDINIPQSFETPIPDNNHKSSSNKHTEINEEEQITSDVHIEPGSINFKQNEYQSNEPENPYKLTPWEINLPQRFKTHLTEFNHKLPSNIQTKLTEEEQVPSNVHNIEPESIHFNQFETNLNELENPDEQTSWNIKIPQRIKTQISGNNHKWPLNMHTEIYKEDNIPSDVHIAPESIDFNQYETNSNEAESPYELTPWNINFPQRFEKINTNEIQKSKNNDYNQFETNRGVKNFQHNLHTIIPKVIHESPANINSDMTEYELALPELKRIIYKEIKTFGNKPEKFKSKPLLGAKQYFPLNDETSFPRDKHRTIVNTYPIINEYDMNAPAIHDKPEDFGYDNVQIVDHRSNPIITNPIKLLSNSWPTRSKFNIDPKEFKKPNMPNLIRWILNDDSEFPSHYRHDMRDLDDEVEKASNILPYNLNAAERSLFIALHKLIRHLQFHKVPSKYIRVIVKRVVALILRRIDERVVKCPMQLRFNRFVKEVEGNIDDDLFKIDTVETFVPFDGQRLQKVLESSETKKILSQVLEPRHLPLIAEVEPYKN